jgi:hypothetical protein
MRVDVVGRAGTVTTRPTAAAICSVPSCGGQTGSFSWRQLRKCRFPLATRHYRARYCPVRQWYYAGYRVPAPTDGFPLLRLYKAGWQNA